MECKLAPSFLFCHISGSQTLLEIIWVQSLHLYLHGLFRCLPCGSAPDSGLGTGSLGALVLSEGTWHIQLADHDTNMLWAKIEGSTQCYGNSLKLTVYDYGSEVSSDINKHGILSYCWQEMPWSGCLSLKHPDAPLQDTISSLSNPSQHSWSLFQSLWCLANVWT